MARYIDADEIRDKFCNCLYWDTTNEYNMYSDILDMIDEAPTEDVQPVVHGHWEIYTTFMYKCSVCGVSPASGTANYCFMCGARMDGDENNG